MQPRGAAQLLPVLYRSKGRLVNSPARQGGGWWEVLILRPNGPEQVSHRRRSLRIGLVPRSYGRGYYLTVLRPETKRYEKEST